MCKINTDRLDSRLILLSLIGQDPEGGWSRFSFTEEYVEACELVKKWMEEAGMTVNYDAAGNLIGRKEGKNPNLPPIAIGSHIDTVKNGGMFDGAFGVIGAIEVVQVIKECNIEHEHPIEVIAFSEEEGSRFGAGLLGSRAMSGKIGKEFLYEKVDCNGETIAEGFRKMGMDPERIEKARKEKGYYKSYLEMHIEQGKILDTNNISVGIVQGICGYVWLKAKFEGNADHAGATPMSLRNDAIVPAAEMIIRTEEIAKEAGDGIVATVGQIKVVPNSINVVPGYAEITFDVRSIDMDNIDAVIERIVTAMDEVCKERGVKGTIEESIRSESVKLPKHMIELVNEAAVKTGCTFQSIVSGAAHDAQMMTAITDVAMIFVPSIGGISHSPYEETSIEDLSAGNQVLLNAVLSLINEK